MKVLVADAVDDAALARLAGAGFEVVTKTGLAGADLAAALEGCQAIIVRSATKVTGDVLKAAPSLKLVVRAGSGLDNVDAATARACGIEVRATPSANAVSVAELAFGLMLAFERHIVPAASALAEGRWEKKRFGGREIAGRTLGIVGFGNIGREMATRARAFGMNVVAHDPLVAAWPADFAWVESVELERLAAESHFVTLHLPLTPDTRGLIGAAELARMREDAVLVNCARGGVVDEGALVSALRAGRPRGAIVDVFEKEPVPADHPLLSLPNVIVTPHLGASTAEAQARAGLEAASVVIDVLSAARARG